MASSNQSVIKIGVSDFHGAYEEQAQFSESGINYYPLPRIRKGSPILKSPINGYFSKFDESGCDIIESVISPVITDKPWVYSIACFQEALAFNYFGLPTPMVFRKLFMKNLLSRDNCKQIVFWSEAGRETLSTYANIDSDLIIGKSSVVYPSIRPMELVKTKKRNFNFFFSGDFFRKGGVNVIDAFEKISLHDGNAKLIICSDLDIDFNTPNLKMKDEYISKIKKNGDITLLGRISRHKLISEVLPTIDVFLLPTYNEAFGFAVLEAMACGIPVICTNVMALPEIVSHQNSGFLIDISDFNIEKIFKGYVVDNIPEQLNQRITNKLVDYMEILMGSESQREEMSMNARQIARDKFSFKLRNCQMKNIYENIIR